MHLVLAATVTELRELKTLGCRLFILRCCVVPLLALRALQCHNLPHCLFLTLQRFNLRSTKSSRFYCCERRSSLLPPTRERSPYLIISEMVPAPTVRPPSRMAKRKPFSMATGVISVISS